MDADQSEKTVTAGVVIEALRSVLAHDELITDLARLKVYETDGLTAKKQVPWVVALPGTKAQVQAVMRIAHRHGIPVVARGAGTGLSGGAMPHAHGILLSLARFNQVVSVDTENLLARVQPGVTNLSISEHVAPLGLFYAPDPSSQIACTIGGNVAENSGGVHCLKYGLTVHNVRAVEVVTAEGELATIGGDALDTSGYDLLALLHGSEGMLGVIVEVTVKLVPKPETVNVVLASFADVRSAGEAVSAIISAGILPAGLEMMDQPAIRAAEAFVHAGYPVDAGAILLCELDGSPESVSTDLEALRGVLAEAGATAVREATRPEDRALVWQGRKAAFPAVGRLAPDYYCMDGTIPRRELPEVLEIITQLGEKYQLAVANVFHAGDGNLHPLILYDANQGDELERAESFGAEILELCVARGGTITGEHGVGVEKIDQMCVQFSPAELDLFHGVKAAFDDTGILNPGKAVPTLSRCAEFGAMHVHRGEEKFPDLPRF